MPTFDLRFIWPLTSFKQVSPSGEHEQIGEQIRREREIDKSMRDGPNSELIPMLLEQLMADRKANNKRLDRMKKDIERIIRENRFIIEHRNSGCCTILWSNKIKFNLDIKINNFLQFSRCYLILERLWPRVDYYKHLILLLFCLIFYVILNLK